MTAFFRVVRFALAAGSLLLLVARIVAIFETYSHISAETAVAYENARYKLWTDCANMTAVFLKGAKERAYCDDARVYVSVPQSQRVRAQLFGCQTLSTCVWGNMDVGAFLEPALSAAAFVLFAGGLLSCMNIFNTARACDDYIELRALQRKMKE